MKPGKGFNQPVSNHAFDYMKELNDAEFEKLVAMIFKERGYAVSEKRDREDHAVDVVLEMDDEVEITDSSLDDDDWECRREGRLCHRFVLRNNVTGGFEMCRRIL